MKITPLFITYLLLAINCNSQSLFEKLNGAQTNYRFTSNSKYLPVKSQGLVSKGIYNYNHHTETIGDHGGAGYGYGYGYQAYQLQFIASTAVRTVERISEDELPKFIEVKFYDQSENHIFTITSRQHSILVSFDALRRSIISINANQIPIAILNEAKRIDIKKVITRYYTTEELKQQRRERRLIRRKAYDELIRKDNEAKEKKKEERRLKKLKRKAGK